MELGGDFELDITQLKDTDDHVFRYLSEYQTVYTDSGRSALRLLQRDLSKGKILMPIYICTSVIELFQCNENIEFYKIKRDFSIDFEDLKQKLNSSVDVFYLMHYFGWIQDRDVLQYIYEKRAEYNYVIVEDTTHSIFTQKHTIGDYCVCSLRKWFPIMDGGVLYSRRKLPVSDKYNERKNCSRKLEAMILKKLYIESELECNTLYRSIFADSEQNLNGQRKIYRMSAMSEVLLKSISVSKICEQRVKNYRELMRHLSRDQVELIVGNDDVVPLVCPVYVDARDEFREYLIDNYIYCAVHWPLPKNALEQDQTAAWIAKHVISLPLDQRYDILHMQYMEKMISGYRKVL